MFSEQIPNNDSSYSSKGPVTPVIIKGEPENRANIRAANELRTSVSEIPMRFPVFSPRRPPNAIAPERLVK